MILIPFPFSTLEILLYLFYILKVFLSIISSSNLSHHFMPLLHLEYLPSWHFISSFSAKNLRKVSDSTFPPVFPSICFSCTCTVPSAISTFLKLLWSNLQETRPSILLNPKDTSCSSYLTGSLLVLIKVCINFWKTFYFGGSCDAYYLIMFHPTKYYVSLFYVFAIVFQSLYHDLQVPLLAFSLVSFIKLLIIRLRDKTVSNTKSLFSCSLYPSLCLCVLSEVRDRETIYNKINNGKQQIMMCAMQRTKLTRCDLKKKKNHWESKEVSLKRWHLSRDWITRWRQLCEVAWKSSSSRKND